MTPLLCACAVVLIFGAVRTACESDALTIVQTGGLDTTMMTFSVRFLREETWPDKGLPYYEALEQAGVAVPTIQGLSIRPRAAVLTLNDVGEYHRLLTNGFTFQEQHVQVTPEKRRTTTSVHVFVDAGVQDEDLQRKLKTFGTVVGPITHKYDLYKGHRIDAGVRYVNMILKEVVPSFVEIEMSGGGKATCRIWHNGQVKTCRICKKEGHIARNCPLDKPSPSSVRRNGSNPWVQQRENENEVTSKDDRPAQIEKNEETRKRETEEENREMEAQELGQEEEKEKPKAKKHRRGTEMSSANSAIGDSEEEESTSKHGEEDEPWLEAGPRAKNDRRTLREQSQDPKKRKTGKKHS